jgi:hypothetical protein
MFAENFWSDALGDFIRAFKDLMGELQSTGCQFEAEFEQTEIRFTLNDTTPELAQIQTLALLALVTSNSEFLKRLSAISGTSEGFFNYEGIIDHSILEHFNAIFERRLQAEVSSTDCGAAKLAPKRTGFAAQHREDRR